MKKILCLLLCFLMLFSACGETANQGEVKTDGKTAEVEVKDDEGTEVTQKVAFSNKEAEAFLASKVMNLKLPEYEPKNIKPNLPNYTVKNDLSDLSISKHIKLSNAEKEMLSKNLFFARKFRSLDGQDKSFLQPFVIYEENDYLNVPSFITSDSIFHAYHIFYDFSLRTLEQEKLYDIALDLSKKLYEKSLEIYNSTKDSDIKEIALRNVQYFAVAMKLFGGELDVIDEAKQVVDSEIQKVEAKGGMQSNDISGYAMDYSQFTVRGHYTRTPTLGKYFKGFMWYGTFGLPVYKGVDSETKEPIRDEKSVAQGMMITDMILSDEKLVSAWQKLYEPTVFYVGKADDLTFYDYSKINYTIFGEKVDYEKLMSKETMDKFYELAKELPQPGIDNSMETVDLPAGQQFRFMGQRFIIDSAIMQELVKMDLRPIPSGLDVASALGSKEATEIQLADEYNTQWDEYEPRLKEQQKMVSEIPEKDWQRNLYTGWLWTIQSYFDEYGEGYPSFMQNKAWNLKNLNSGLASWAELRHDTILYGKQVGAEMGGDIPEDIKGYVEPNIELYQKLKWLTDYSLVMLQQMAILPESSGEAAKSMSDTLQFLIEVSEKELKGEPLTEDEYRSIQYFGGNLEHLMSRAADVYHWFEITQEVDKNMPVIADVATINDYATNQLNFLEVAVENPYEIYVVCDIEGEKVLTRGAIFGYNEFLTTERLTDEKWQEILKQGKEPERPQWMKAYVVD